MATEETLIKSVTEKEFQSQIKDLARLFGWKYYHTWRSIHSPAGFPDCVLAKPPRLIFAELKSEKGKTSQEQDEWLNILAECGQEVYLWKPRDVDRIIEILR